MTTTPSLTRRQKLVLVLLILGGGLLFNRDFLRHWPLATMLQMNDVKSILAGYYMTPHLLHDSLRWWHGPWIQQGIYSLRPVSAYLYWSECWIGLHWGFLADAWLGYALYIVNCLLGTALAWRLTRSWPCTLLAALLTTLVQPFNIPQPTLWLAWFPVHQDLLMNAFLLAALVSFDRWFLSGKRRSLLWSWAFFILACLSKEHAYLFPMFAATGAAFRRPPVLRRLAGFAQAAAMLLTVALLWVYRSAVIQHPRNPTAGIVPQLHALLTDTYGVMGMYLLTGTYWLPGLAALLLALAVGAVHLRRARWSGTLWGRRLARPSVILVSVVAVLWLYLLLTVGSPAQGFWFFADGAYGSSHAQTLVTMLVMLYGIFLLWKYRRLEDTAAAFVFLALSYVPVLGFIGWHYTLPAWFVRVGYDVLIVKLVWLDWGSTTFRTLRIPRSDRFAATAEAT